MKLRQHRGGLSDSMATTVEIDPTSNALLAAMQPVMAPRGVDLTLDMIHVEPYGGIDKRIGWDTHIVTIDGYGVYGFTSGPLREPPNVQGKGQTPQAAVPLDPPVGRDGG